MKEHDDTSEEPQDCDDGPGPLRARAGRRHAAKVIIGAMSVLGGIAVAMALGGHGSSPLDALPMAPPAAGSTAVPAAAVSPVSTPAGSISPFPITAFTAGTGGQMSRRDGTTKAAAPASDLTTSATPTPTPTDTAVGPGVPTAPALVPSVSASSTESVGRKPSPSPTTAAPSPSPTATYTQW